MKSFRLHFQKPYKISIKAFLLFFSILLVIIFIMTAGYISYNTTVELIVKKLEMIDESKLIQERNKLTASLHEMEKMTENLLADKLLQKLVVDYNKTVNFQYESTQIQKKLLEYLLKIRDTYNNIDNITIYTRDGYALKSNSEPVKIGYSEVKNSKLYKRIESSDNNVKTLESGFEDDILGCSINGLAFTGIIKDEEQEMAVLLIVMKLGWLEEMNGSSGNITMIDKKNSMVVWNGNKNIDIAWSNILGIMETSGPVFTKSIDGRIYKFFCVDALYNEWIFVKPKKIADISELIWRIRNYALLAVAIALIFGILAGRLILYRVSLPVSKLMNIIKSYKIQGKVNADVGNKDRLSVRDLFMVYFTIIIIVPILTYCTIFYYFSSQVMENIMRTSLVSVIVQTADNIDFFAENNERISINIIFNTHIQDWFIKNNQKEVNISEKIKKEQCG